MQLPTLLDVTCCLRGQTLLHVVGSCCAKFEAGQTFESTTPKSSVGAALRSLLIGHRKQ